jgi:hypothetical protein
MKQQPTLVFAASRYLGRLLVDTPSFGSGSSTTGQPSSRSSWSVRRKRNEAGRCAVLSRLEGLWPLWRPARQPPLPLLNYLDAARFKTTPCCIVTETTPRTDL